MCGVAMTGSLSLLQGHLDQILWILLSAVAVYYYVGLVMNVCEIQFASSMGYQIGYVHALEQALGMTIMLGLVAAVNGVSPYLQDAICKAFLSSSDVVGTAASMTGLWRGLAHLVVSVVVSGALIWVAVKAAYSGIAMQIAHIQGQPNAVSESVGKLITLLVGGAITVLSVWGANIILDTVLFK